MNLFECGTAAVGLVRLIIALLGDVPLSTVMNVSECSIGEGSAISTGISSLGCGVVVGLGCCSVWRELAG